MDLLSQYKQDHPEAFQERKPAPMTDEYGRTYTGMIALVMRLSGGRIKDARQASYMLFGMIGVFMLMTVIVLLIFNTAHSGKSSPQEVEQLMREAPPPSVVEPQFMR